MTEKDVEELIGKFYTYDIPNEDSPSSGSNDSSINKFTENVRLIAPITKQNIDLIVRIANEVNLFKEQLDANDAKVLLGDFIKNRCLSSVNNTRVVLFFDRLASHDIISNTWQVDITKRQLIRSSSGGKILAQHDFSSTLYRLKERSPTLKERELISLIDKIIEKSKEDK